MTSTSRFKAVRPGLHECANCRKPWADHSWDARCPDPTSEATDVDVQDSASESDGIADAEIRRLQQTARSQRGMLKVQGEEITRLRRQVRGAQITIKQCEATNGRIAKDLVDAWEFIWRVAGGAIVGANARQIARNYLLNRKSTEADRG